MSISFRKKKTNKPKPKKRKKQTKSGVTHLARFRGVSISYADFNLFRFLPTDADPVMALNRAKKSLDHWRSTLNDQWNIHGLIASNGYGLDGLPWATSHYSFHLVLWHLPLALSGQLYNAGNASLTFWPKYQIPFNLPFFTPKAIGTIQGSYEKGNDKDEDFEEEEEMFTFTVDSGERKVFYFGGVRLIL